MIRLLESMLSKCVKNSFKKKNSREKWTKKTKKKRMITLLQFTMRSKKKWAKSLTKAMKPPTVNLTKSRMKSQVMMK
jgi:hypothetical protein